MSIAVDSQCIVCYLERNLKVARSHGTEEQATAFAKELMKRFVSAPGDVSAPWFGPAAADLLHEMYGLPIDRFQQEKHASNRFIIERYDQIKARVEAAPDPVKAGLQVAILGNYLDFSALGMEVSFEKLEDMLTQALEMELDAQSYVNFCAELEAGTKLLYLTDNAGEIGFDRIFAEEIAKKYPHLTITFCVRGGIAQNDATREDAAAVGIPFPIIDNGNRVPGTQLDQLGAEAKSAIETADVILSKGQGNVETLFGCGYNIYYAFLIKCPRFVERFGKPKLTPMFLKERT